MSHTHIHIFTPGEKIRSKLQVKFHKISLIIGQCQSVERDTHGKMGLASLKQDVPILMCVCVCFCFVFVFVFFHSQLKCFLFFVFSLSTDCP